MISNKTLNGLKIKYDYPPVPPYGISMGIEYKVDVNDGKYKIVAGDREIRLKEQDIRTFFVVSK